MRRGHPVSPAIEKCGRNEDWKTEVTTGISRDGIRNDGFKSHGGRNGGRGDEDRHPDLTVSVFLRTDLVRSLEAHAEKDRPGTIPAALEERIRSLYPGAVVSVQVIPLLDSEWEVQIGEMGRSRMGGADREVIERRLRSVVEEAVTRFRGPA